jgi:hypothetical protein
MDFQIAELMRAGGRSACISMAENMLPSHFTRPGWQFLILLFVVVIAPVPARAQDALVALKAALSTEVRVPSVPVQPIETRRPRPIRRPLEDRSSRRFLALSLGVYAAAFMDMRESVSLWPRFKEQDPFAKPFTHLPAPAYYMAGAALASGLNWVSLKMARSERWHRVWWVPQIGSIAGNTFGYAYTKMHEHPR